MVVVEGPDGEEIELTDDELAGRTTLRAPAPADDGRDQFFTELAARLEQGSIAYQDKSFDRPVQDLLTELEQEALDLAGWGYVLWQKIQRMRVRTVSG